MTSSPTSPGLFSSSTRVRTTRRRGTTPPAPATAMALQAARRYPAAFLRVCLTDPEGRPLDFAPVHDELQAFLSAHRHALVELPRDHGKSTQVFGRVLWELGRNPALRVKVVCATEAIANDRSRF